MYQFKIPISSSISSNYINTNDNSNIDDCSNLECILDCHLNKYRQLELDIISQLKPEYIKINQKGFADLLSCCLETTNKIRWAKDKIENIKESVWEEIKKATNPYELIYATPCIAIANIKPLSRSFFKMIEMIYEFTNGWDGNMNGLMDIPVLVSLHIAEGPGGFIEATRYIRKTKGGINDTAFGITLSNKSEYNENIKNIPAWKQSNNFLRNHPEVIISFGADGTGNIYNPDNINHLYNEIHTHCSNKDYNISNANQYASASASASTSDIGDIHFSNNKNIFTKLNIETTQDSSIDINSSRCKDDIRNEAIDCSKNQLVKKGHAIFITADGGFDYSVDYNYQEQASSKLIFSQIITALKCQAINGTFICKIFDINLFITVEMIYLLHLFYKEVIIYKPFTSRIANSEKYLVCTGFKGIGNNILDKLLSILAEWNKVNLAGHTFNRLGLEIPREFIEELKRINKTIVSNQINVINEIMNIYYNKLNLNPEWKKENSKIQYNNAVEWCRKYKIPYN